MNITLRPYQADLYDRTRQALKSIGPRLIVCMATGGGKTKLFVKIAQDSSAKGRAVLVLSESLAILGQIKDEIPSCKELGFVQPGEIMVGMSQTLIRRPAILARLAELGRELLIIADEAHIGTHTKVLAQMPDAFLLGFTATPDYRKAKHLPALYEGIVVGPQPAELVGLGSLAQYRHYERRGVDLGGLEKRNGEFTEESQHIAFDSPQSLQTLVEDMSKFPYKQAMIFTSSIKSAGIVASMMPDCVEVHTGVENADFNLWRFKSGEVRHCISVGSLTKGFDHPPVDLVVLWRATTSLPLYLQMIGRGSRVVPGVKEEFTVLDYGANGSRHGRWDFDHDWETMWNGSNKGKGVAPSRICPVCFSLLPVQVMVCPSCGHTWKVKPPDRKKIEETQLVKLAELSDGRLISTLSPAELGALAKRGYKPAFCARVARSKGRDFLAAYSDFMGYKSGWIQRQMDMPGGFADVVVRT